MANTFHNLDLPVLAGVNAEDIMRIRKDEGEAFQRFRLLLDQKLIGVREKENPEEAERAANYAAHELTQVRIDEIDTKLKGVREKLGVNALIAGLGRAATVQTAGVELLSTALAVANIGKTILDYSKR